jgi:wyosine [tRNA(Phe)-imidazoG37] synthetase (radical SAM superfamily)
LGEEQKLIEDFKSLQSYTSFVNNSDGVIEGKVREFDYSTVVIAADISQQQTLLKELYRPAGGDKWDSVVKFI